jgi:hypothetical protein
MNTYKPCLRRPPPQTPASYISRRFVYTRILMRHISLTIILCAPWRHDYEANIVLILIVIVVIALVVTKANNLW